MDGEEAVQVYVSVPKSKVERHKKVLKGFKKVSLEPDESKDVKMDIPYDELRYFCEQDNTWKLEHTNYVFLVGPSANDKVLMHKTVTI